VTFDAQDFFTRFVRAIDEKDRATLEEMIHPDYVSDSPQSGERSRGFEQFWAQLVMYPDGGVANPVESSARLLKDEDRWAITPAYTVVPLEGKKEFTTFIRAQYPDGSWWRIVVIVELRDEKIWRATNYFAPELPAPLAESIAAYQHG
jgi:hypothetical protein